MMTAIREIREKVVRIQRWSLVEHRKLEAGIMICMD